MNKRTKWVCALCVVLALIMSGCGEKTPSETNGKTQVSMMYFNQLPEFEKLVEDTYPDIDLVIEQNTSATLDDESERRLQNDNGSDIITTTLPGGAVKNYTYDLCAEKFVLNYSGSMIKLLLIDGQTRFLPLPGQYYGYVVNKTLVKELGYELPESNQQIFEILNAAQEKKLGVGANNDCIGFYNIGENYLANLILGNYVPDFLSTPDGIIWLEEIQQGKNKFSGNMEHSMDFILNCVDKGYFDSGAVLSSNSVTISNKNAVHVADRLIDRSMVMAYGDVELYQLVSKGGTDDEFTMLPFLSSEGRPGWLIGISSGYLAVNKALAAEGQEKKLEAALKVLDLLSTTEGQRVWMNDTKAVFSYLKNGESLSQNIPDEVKDAVNHGYVFNTNLPNNIAEYFGRQMNLVINGKAALSDAMAAVDNYQKNGADPEEQARTIVGKVSEDLLYRNYNTRTEETAIGNLIADAVKEYSGAQIALVNGGSIRSSLYDGDVWDADLAAVCPYGNKIVTVNITGAALKEALTNGISQTNRGTQVPGGRFLQVSGIKYSFKPMKNEKDKAKLIEVTLADGTPIDDNATYLVAVTDYMAGKSSYNDGNGDGFVMLNVYDDTVEKNASLVKETGGTYRDALKLYFTAQKGNTVTAKTEGRITVVK